MRIAQSRMAIWDWWALLAIGVFFMWSGGARFLRWIPYHRAFPIFCTIVMVGAALYMTIEHLHFKDSILFFENPPLPGGLFRGRIQTPLTSGAGKVELRAIQYEPSPLSPGHRRVAIWRSQTAAQPTRSEGGLVLSFELSIPKDLAMAVSQWELNATAPTKPFAYSAQFFFKP